MQEVVTVDTVLRWWQFLRLPRQVYPQDSAWVPPLNLLTFHSLGMGFPGRDTRLFLALDKGAPVGRVAVRVHSYGGKDTLHFGFFECLPGYSRLSRRLLDEAHAFAPDLTMRGPYHFRMEDPYTGLLVEGFEEDPSFWTAYNPPYYLHYFQDAGFAKTQDMWSYHLDWDSLRSQGLQRAATRAKEQGLRICPLDRGARVACVKRVAHVMNCALAENWGFEEFSQSQVTELTLMSYVLLDPDWLLEARKKDESVGAAIVLQDFNPWIKVSGGRLTPTLLWKLLFHKKRLPRIRAWALGILPEHQNGSVSASLIWACIEEARVGGVQCAEVSWVLEHNRGMNAFLRAIGGRRTRTHRILEREPQA